MVGKSKKRKRTEKLVRAAKELEAKADPSLPKETTCLKWGGGIGFV